MSTQYTSKTYGFSLPCFLWNGKFRSQPYTWTV